MPDIKTILIVILVAYMAFWYMNPDQGKEWIDKGVDGTKSIFDNIKPVACPDTFDPVCVNETTYKNPCLAKGLNYTLGECGE